ncbi:MAG: aminotransferase class III-fold pyridoxal phosphate-dependent enzyme, partial [Candidatus Aminicenantales bacterium]
PEDARKLTRELYGMDVSVYELEGYIGQNFHLKDEKGQEYVLKIADPSENEAVLDLQNRAIEHLSRHHKNIRWPKVFSSLSGEKIVTVSSKEGLQFHARLLSYLSGPFLAEIEKHSASLLDNLGRFLGLMDKTLESFSHPAANRDIPWDLKNTLLSRKRITSVPDSRKRRLVEYFLLQFETFVEPVLSILPKSIIHNDINDHNVLVEKTSSGDERIAGLIDFGDIIRTCTVFEIAIALTYTMLGKDEPLAAAAHVIRGYHEEHPLTEQELDILYYLICARLCISVTMSAYHKRIEPDKKYISVSEEQAWSLLERLLETNPEKARQEFHRACGLSFSLKRMKREEIMAGRHRHIGQSLSLFYRKPLHIIGGAMQYLYDDEGKTYLDCINNVCHVGHCHPRVVQAAKRQMALINTNTRFLYEQLVQYAHRLTAFMPEPLSVCYFVNSGSEANDLALRLARTYTGRQDVIVVDGAYHGHLSSLIEISPYKFDGPGGSSPLPFVHKVPTPDVYRGKYKASDPEAGKKYASYIQETIERIQKEGKSPAAFICESLMGCAGHIIYPEGYLQEAFQQVRRAGGLCITDEVQVGFGRVGTHFWGFETQGVVPDIVTLGKPIGNGHPLAAVVTTPEVAEAFVTGMEYFNTFGGNPVSCAVGMAVLDVVQEEKLQENALRVGVHLKHGLEGLKERFELVGDVRGLGLFLGVELVLDHETLEPASEQALLIIERMKELGIILSVEGSFSNVLKIKPPMVFSEENADFLLHCMEKVLLEIEKF